MAGRNKDRGLVLGVVSAMALHLLVLYLSARYGKALNFSGSPSTQAKPIIDQITFFAFWWIGIFQFTYIIPLVLVSRQLEYFAFMKGVIITAVMTAFLNGSCWLLVYVSL